MNRLSSPSTRGVAVALLSEFVVMGCATGDTTTATVEGVTARAVERTQQALTAAPTQRSEPTPSPAPTPGSAPSPTPRPIVTGPMVFTSDVLSHTPVIGQALRYGAESDLDYDYRPISPSWRRVLVGRTLPSVCSRPPVSADNIGLDCYLSFEAPRELPEALVDAGYDGCSTASNHSRARRRGGNSEPDGSCWAWTCGHGSF